MPGSYIRRLVDPLLDELLAGLPAVLLVGPRACGKTTTARRRAESILRVDLPENRRLAARDPDALLAAHDEPVLIDEWQAEPEILGAVKRAVDEDFRPARFVMTGSTGADLGSAGWPATGRVARIPLWGLTEREIEGDVSAPSFLDRLIEGGVAALATPRRPPDLRSYVDRALRGGLPAVAIQDSAKRRDVLLASHVDQLTGRDMSALGPVRDPALMRRYLTACAANTAGVVQHKVLYDAATLARTTALAYDSALQLTFVVDVVPAWKGGQLQRLTSTPKRYLIDPGLLRPLLNVDERGVIRNPDLLGRLLDTFVAAQLRPELPVSQGFARLFHLREANGRHEIDLMVELAGGDVLAFEIKAGGAPERSDARHLVWLRDRLGERFLAGVVLHTGRLRETWDDRIAAAPIAAIWS